MGAVKIKTQQIFSQSGKLGIVRRIRNIFNIICNLVIRISTFHQEEKDILAVQEIMES
jgi:hypothetical protein